MEEEVVTLYHMPSWLVDRMQLYASMHLMDFETAVILALKEWSE